MAPKKKAEAGVTPAATLRALPVSQRHFWQDTVADQIALGIKDQNADYVKRALPGNEIAVLALNEIAAKHRRGFFYHLPTRAALTSSADPERLPAGRKRPEPGTSYTSIVYSDFVWGQQDAQNFFDDTHRARYLKSSFLTNTPPAFVPLYAIQYTPQWNPVYLTSPPSLVVFATASAYHVWSTAMLERIVGRDKDVRKLGSTNWLWNSASLEKGKDTKERKEKCRLVKANVSLGLEDVYHAIVHSCVPGEQESSFTAAELQHLVPRPDPEHASAAGAPLGTGRSGLPPTRRGVVYPGRKRKHQEALVDEVDTGSNNGSDAHSDSGSQDPEAGV